MVNLLPRELASNPNVLVVFFVLSFGLRVNDSKPKNPNEPSAVTLLLKAYPKPAFAFTPKVDVVISELTVPPVLDSDFPYK